MEQKPSPREITRLIPDYVLMAIVDKCAIMKDPTPQDWRDRPMNEIIPTWDELMKDVEWFNLLLGSLGDYLKEDDPED